MDDVDRPGVAGDDPRLPAELDHQAERLTDAATDRLSGDLSRLIALFFAVAMHLIVGWFHLASGLVAPPWASLLLIAEWIVLAVLLWRWRRGNPLALLAIPFISAAIWFLVISAGGAFLGWTADDVDLPLIADGEPGPEPPATPAPTEEATAAPASPEAEPVRYVTTTCEGSDGALQLVCEVHGLIRSRHVEPPDDGALAAAAAAAVEPGSGDPALVCPLPSDAFRVLCDALAQGDPVDEDVVRDLVDQMILGSLDPYSGYQTPAERRISAEERDGEVEGIGALVTATNTASDDPSDRSCTVLSDTCRVLFVSILPDTPAEAAGLREGDLLVSVDGTDVAGSTLNDVVEKVRGPAGTPVTLTVERDGEPVTVSPTRAAIELTIVTSRVLDDGVGYLQLVLFSNNSAELFREELRGLLDAGIDTLVLDLRDNPGGSLDAAVAIASEFLDDGLVLRTKAPDEDRPYRVLPGGIAPDDLELIVLVDRGSASASEVVSGAWQDQGRATIVGERTFGKNSVQQTFTLDEGGALRLTIAKWVTPAGRDFGEVGIAPDVEVVLPADLTVEEAVDQALAALGR